MIVTSVTGDGIIVYYLDGGILEKRTLPDLKVQQTALIGQDRALTALIAGHVEGSGVPFAVFQQDRRGLIVNEIDLSNLSLGKDVLFPGVDHYQMKRGPGDWLSPTAISKGGRRAWFGNNHLEQKGPENYEFTPRAGNFTSGVFFTNHDGTQIFSNRSGYNIQTKRQWTDQGSIQRTIIPDDQGTWLLGVFRKSENDISEIALQILDPVTKAARYEIRSLSEWTEEHERSFWKKSARSYRAQLLGKKPYLATVSTTGETLVIRKISLNK